MKPPQPPELAMLVISCVARHVEFELEPVRVELAERLKEPSEEYIWPRAEGIAADVIDTLWTTEVVDQCERGLAEAHEELLVAAMRCVEAADELRERGLDSWIGGAIRHRLAFDAAWETLGEEHGVMTIECGCACGADCARTPDPG